MMISIVLDVLSGGRSGCVTRITPWGYAARDEDGAPAGSGEIAITAHTGRRRDGR